jgi:hypothetical protein
VIAPSGSVASVDSEALPALDAYRVPAGDAVIQQVAA